LDLHHIAVRALFVYLVLLGLVRLSGKKTVSQGTPFAFVLALVLGDLIDDALWAEVPAAQFVVAAGTLAMVHLLVSWSTSRQGWLDRLVSGDPSPVIAGGRMDRRGMRRERLNEKELAFETRQRGVDRERWVEVDSARIEANGEISLLKADWARPPRRRDAAAVREARTR
jgi:uncharacterized membrane protein YcaP (DUF421 family)